MKILILLPSSRNAFDIITQALFLKKKGHVPIFLSFNNKGDIHIFLELKGIENHSLNINRLSSKNYILAFMALSRFIFKKRIDCIISNNLQGNFLAVLAQFFHRKRTFLTRHHSDYILKEKNKNAKRQLAFVNKFGKEFIAISDRVKEQLLKEMVEPEKIHRINLGFDFSLYKKPVDSVVIQLTKDYGRYINLCVIARLIPLKRHLLLFESVKMLNNKNIDILLWVVGDGPLMNELKEWILDNELEHAIKMIGYVNDPENYIAASDLLVHISESEASSHVIREAALVGTPILACKNVGDIDDYIQDGINGFLIEKESSSIELSSKILEINSKTEVISKLTSELKNTILSRFDISKSGPALIKIIENE